LNSIEHYQQLIEQALKEKKYGTHPKELYEPMEYIVSLGGKRLRPVLVLAGYQLFNDTVEKAIPAAIAIELFHNFSLIHDDIMDQAPLRRNKATVHKKWNENIAILSGDAMLVKAYQELCKTNSEKLPELLNIFSQTAVKVCEGQQLDMNYEKQNKVSIQQYLKMIELKTAVLLGASLQLGAVIAGAKAEDAQHLYDFGKHVGIAFQLQDDILDVYADAEKFGKQQGGDIVSNKKTFLLLKALELSESNRYLKEELHQWIHAPEFNPTEKIQAVTNIFNFLNIPELARKEMQLHYNLAIASYNKLSSTVGDKNILLQYADGLMVRQV
jgi:geranylgeranyl diphosphate synthase type II